MSAASIVDGHLVGASFLSDARLARALAALKSRASLFRILGSYPRAVL